MQSVQNSPSRPAGRSRCTLVFFDAWFGMQEFTQKSPRSPPPPGNTAVDPHFGIPEIKKMTHQRLQCQEGKTLNNSWQLSTMLRILVAPPPPPRRDRQDAAPHHERSGGYGAPTLLFCLSHRGGERLSNCRGRRRPWIGGRRGAKRTRDNRAAHISSRQEAPPAQFRLFEGGGALSSPLAPTPPHHPDSVCSAAEAETP